MKIRGKAFAVGAAAVAMTMGFTTSAFAGTNVTANIKDSAKATFYHAGDYFKLCDTSSDGGDPYVEFRYTSASGNQKNGRHDWDGGSGTCSGKFAHDFAEGRSVLFRACLNMPVIPDPCSIWRTGVA